MRSTEVTIGRTFLVVFDHGDDFFPALQDFCSSNDVKQGFIPSFIAGFSEVSIVGTLAYDPDHDTIRPHIHVAVGRKEHSAAGHTSHLLDASVQFLTEMMLIEVASPDLRRIPRSDLFDVPLLRFDRQEEHDNSTGSSTDE